jgi:hypothetical protein
MANGGVGLVLNVLRTSCGPPADRIKIILGHLRSGPVKITVSETEMRTLASPFNSERVVATRPSNSCGLRARGSKFRLVAGEVPPARTPSQGTRAEASPTCV